MIAHRGGAITRMLIDSTEERFEARDRKIGALLAEAVDSLTRAGEHVWWTNELSADSLDFELHVKSGRDGMSPVPRNLRVAFPVFTLGIPQLEPVRAMPRSARPHYPPGLRERGQEGHVLARFVVDSDGRYWPNSFRDVTALSMGLPQGIFGPSHEAFVESVRQALPRMSFEPARIGTCPVAQVVQQPFSFKLGDVPVTTVGDPLGRRSP